MVGGSRSSPAGGGGQSADCAVTCRVRGETWAEWAALYEGRMGGAVREPWAEWASPDERVGPESGVGRETSAEGAAAGESRERRRRWGARWRRAAASRRQDR